MKFIRPKWHKGDIIRNKQDGKPYLVINVFLDSSTAIVDAQDSSLLTPLYNLPIREYHNFALDRDMEFEEQENDLKWNFNPILI